MEFSPTVHQLLLGFVNVYLCVEGGEVTMVDAGMPRQTAKILGYLQKLGLSAQSVKRILVTHADIDHVGSLAQLVKATGATVMASAGTAALLSKGLSPDHMPRFVQFLLDRFVRYQSVTQVQIIQDGDILPYLGGITVLATPGHTPDHHAFYSPRLGVLFAGDALNTRNNQLNLTPDSITADHDDAKRSARRLLDLAPVFVACGHGTPMRQPSSEKLGI